MQHTRKISIAITTLSAVLIALLPVTTIQAASKEKVLHVFGTGNDGINPSSSLIADAAGNFYGTTSYGGGNNGCHGYGCGVAFQLIPGGNGQWTEKVIYTFCPMGSHCVDGAIPQGNLVMDAAGNLYGTTTTGGSGSGCFIGCGTVFELSPGAQGKWTEKVLYSFLNSGQDETSPNSLILDAAGNLYGTTSTSYGTCVFSTGCGIVFKLTRRAQGQWSQKVLYKFDGTHGSDPVGLTMDAGGHLFGTTGLGGAGSCSCGTVFELTQTSKGQWKERVLYSFLNGADGAVPSSAPILDPSGAVIGATYLGGTSGCLINYGYHTCGLVFEVASDHHGHWAEKVLYSFEYNFVDGENPRGNLVFDPAGNLYGTTYGGGTGQCPLTGCGTVFELSPGARGSWHEKVLHSFQDDGKDGTYPIGGVTLGKAGNLFGVTFWGYSVSGIAYELTP
jgi:uncharacterized repeat protein (TIGR03803 family)